MLMFFGLPCVVAAIFVANTIRALVITMCVVVPFMAFALYELSGWGGGPGPVDVLANASGFGIPVFFALTVAVMYRVRSIKERTEDGTLHTQIWNRTDRAGIILFVVLLVIVFLLGQQVAMDYFGKR